MKINDKYKIEVVVIEVKENGSTGDCYDNLEEFKNAHLLSNYTFGFTVIEIETGLIPEWCNDWNDTLEDALIDYDTNVRN